MAIGIAFVLFASFAACYGQGPQDHGQQCTRSTDCTGVLLCRNRMCVCPGFVHYLGGGLCAGVTTTVKPKGYGEDCTAHRDCNGALGLGCKKTRTCGCYPDNHFDDATGRCEADKLNGESCVWAMDCIGDLGCYNSICACREDRELVGDRTCQPRPATPAPYSKIVGEACTSSFQCKGGKTICPNSVCECADTNNWEWDDSIGDCKRKPLTKLQNEPCQSSMECKGRLWCINNLCNCEDGATYEEATDTCRRTKTLGETCELSSECVGDLFCRDGTCKCLNGVFDGTSACNPITTPPPKTIGDSCENDMQCPGWSFCVRSKCACTNEREWDGTDCQIVTTPAPKRNGDSCQWSFECIGSLYCVSGVCTCNENTQWDEGSSDCRTVTTPRPKRFGESCGNSGECLGALWCLESKCGCSDGRFHVGSGICVAVDSPFPKGYGETCASDSGCKYPFACSGSACACPSGATYLESIDVCATESACGGSSLLLPSDSKCYTPVTPAAVSGQTGYGGACSSTSDCPETTSCRDGGCLCQEGAFYIGTLAMCAKTVPISTSSGSVPMFGNCRRNSDCKNTAKCMWGQCYCPFDTTVYFDQLDTCLTPVTQA